MKEMWTGVYPERDDYNYEIRFRTDCRDAYEAVQAACRKEIDKRWYGGESAEEEPSKDFWLKVQCDDNPQAIVKVTKEDPIVEIECRCGNEFVINTADSEWNHCGIITCGCGRKIIYEKI